MRSVAKSQVYWLNILAQIRPATVKQLNCLAGVALDTTGSRDAMEKLVLVGLVRKYQEPKVKRRYLRATERRAIDLCHNNARPGGRRPWIYEITFDGINYLEGASICNQVLERLDPRASLGQADVG